MPNETLNQSYESVISNWDDEIQSCMDFGQELSDCKKSIVDLEKELEEHSEQIEDHINRTMKVVLTAQKKFNISPLLVTKDINPSLDNEIIDFFQQFNERIKQYEAKHGKKSKDYTANMKKNPTKENLKKIIKPFKALLNELKKLVKNLLQYLTKRKNNEKETTQIGKEKDLSETESSISIEEASSVKSNKNLCDIGSRDPIDSIDPKNYQLRKEEKLNRSFSEKEKDKKKQNNQLNRSF